MCFILKNNHGKAKKKTPVTIFLDKFNNIFTKGAGKYEKMLNKTVTKKHYITVLLAFCACTFS
jgi:multidrug efflux pump subunit AcrB